MSESVLPMFSSSSFIVSGLAFRSLIHFEFIFVYGVRKCSSFILLQVIDQISQLPGAGERHSTHDKGHEEGGSAYAKAGSSLGSPPGYSRASTPKNQSLPILLLCALTSDFTGGCPYHDLALSVKELTYSSN